MTTKQPVTILGIPIYPYTMKEAVALLTDTVQKKQKLLVVTANAEIIMLAQNDPDYLKLLVHEAGVILPDGAGTVWAGRTLGYDIPERVAGYDLYLELLKKSASEGIGVYFFGGKPGIAELAAQTGAQRYPGLKVAGTRNGYFNEDDVPEIVRDINQSGAQILFAALGAPKQEKWLAQHKAELQPSLLMGIGGSFDVLAGKVKRAPVFMQKARLEWFYRLLKQPSRLGRMLVLPKFVEAVLTAKKNHN